MEATGNYYTVSHIALFTGLTDRTIRSYIASGILRGEKINGLWHFTPEEVETFIRHPAVWPSIRAKKNGIVYDFLGLRSAKTQEACMILDLPGEDPKRVAEYFCYTISNGEYENLRFSFDSDGGVPRIILRGEAKAVLALAEGYWEQ